MNPVHMGWVSSGLFKGLAVSMEGLNFVNLFAKNMTEDHQVSLIFDTTDQ